MIIYVVVAELDAYSDSRHWIVSAFSDRGTAERLALRAAEAAKRVDEWRCPKCNGKAIAHDEDLREAWPDACHEPYPRNPWDPDMLKNSHYDVPDRYEVTATTLD